MPDEVNGGLINCSANNNWYLPPEWDCSDSGEKIICKSFNWPKICVKFIL